ncbi:hypothetical protein QE152_g27622 [Popillia japonica]|uniref:Uridine diphosphate glucose pyrophosphatase NUDT14 n=1 Tax=Popillia japonica TaxID=7064 RepID=A0AAW1JUG6_POPJA
MNKLTQVLIKPLQESIYVKPFTMYYTQNVKQFRPAVYLGSIPDDDRKDIVDTNKYPAELGITLELCAGIVDKDLTLEEIAAEEVLEECGYKIDPSILERVSSYRSGVGTTGSVQTSYYCEVTDDMKVGQGGGVDDEIIEVVEMSISDINKYIRQEHVLSPPSFLFNICWFLQNKLK